MDDERERPKKCVDSIHTSIVIEWQYGVIENEKFHQTFISDATTKRASKIACQHCTYIRDIKYFD